MTLSNNSDRAASTGAVDRDGPIQGWTTSCPPIDPGRILRLHGYRDVSKVRPVIRKAASLIAERARGLVDASGCWRRVAIAARTQGEVRFKGGTTLSCAAFDRLLEGASEIAVFVLTLGNRFDQAVIDLTDNSEPLEALFLETAGRLAIEKLTRVLAAEIGRVLAPQGFALGARLGPGYTYRIDEKSPPTRVMWPLEQQRELFLLLGSAPLPVALMESAVMRPRMSRSGLFGVNRAWA